MKKICQRCATPFGCREDRIELCNCRRISLDNQMREYIQDNYSDCLCPNCLKETKAYFYAADVNPVYVNKIKNK